VAVNHLVGGSSPPRESQIPEALNGLQKGRLMAAFLEFGQPQLKRQTQETFPGDGQPKSGNLKIREAGSPALQDFRFSGYLHPAAGDCCHRCRC